MENLHIIQTMEAKGMMVEWFDALDYIGTSAYYRVERSKEAAPVK